MTKIFLSYAEEDSIIGQEMAAALLNRNIDVYWWQNEPGQRFVNVLPDKIYDADRFVAVLSPDYLRSPWCRREADLAVEIENDRGRKFITIVRQSGVEVDRAGWLSGYDAIPVDRGTYAVAVDTVLLGVDAESTSRPLDRRSAKWSFRNRDQELDLVSGELTVDGGTDVWLVGAPPQLGKSWFLYELAERVKRTVPSCRMSLFNLEDHPQSLRGDCARLLTEVFDLGTPLLGDVSGNLEAVLTPAVIELSGRGEQQLYLLDGADLLETNVVRDLRNHLTVIFELLREAGWTSRIRIVISGRQVDDWRPVAGVRSRKLPLTEFREEVVGRALINLGPPPGLGADRVAQIARRAHRMCEGLPALLVPILDEINEARFIVWADAWWEGVYERVVVPYVRSQLLSVDSLFRAGGEELTKARQDIENTLRRLVVYRMVTWATLAHLKSVRMFRVVRATALFSSASEDPWDRIDPPIRRLLYRYYYPDPAERLAVESDALDYYRRWAERPAEREQPVVLVQCIWHEASRRSTGLAEPLDALPAFATSLTAELLDPSRYGVESVAAFTERLLDGDLELLTLLGPELFEAVVTAVRSTIEAMGGEQ